MHNKNKDGKFYRIEEISFGYFFLTVLPRAVFRRRRRRNRFLKTSDICTAYIIY